MQFENNALDYEFKLLDCKFHIGKYVRRIRPRIYRNLLWRSIKYEYAADINFSASFCRSFAAFRFRAISQSPETSSHLVAVVIVTGSIFASHGTPLLRVSLATIDVHFGTSGHERMCVGNAKRSEVHYRELGRGEYITRRIWSGYVPDSVVYNLTPCNLTSSGVSWIKEATAILTSRLLA